LNGSYIESKQQYLDILKGFNLEIRDGARGLCVFVTDRDGNAVRHPVSLSEFTIQPCYDKMQGAEPLKPDLIQQRQSEIDQLLKALNKQYRFYTEDELRSVLFRNKLVLYRNSKNDNLTVFSIKDKSPIDAQFILKKHRSRLMDFALTDDDFYGLVRDCGKQLFDGKESYILNPSGLRSISAKPNTDDLKFAVDKADLCRADAFKECTSGLHSIQSNAIEKAVKSNLIYLLDRAEERILKQNIGDAQSSQWNYLDMVKNQLKEEPTQPKYEIDEDPFEDMNEEPPKKKEEEKETIIVSPPPVDHSARKKNKKKRVRKEKSRKDEPVTESNVDNWFFKNFGKLFDDDDQNMD